MTEMAGAGGERRHRSIPAQEQTLGAGPVLERAGGGSFYFYHW